MSSDTIGIRRLLTAPETTATVAHAIIRDKYGEEVYDWDLLTVLYELQDDFGVETSSSVSNRWAAMQTVMTSDVFFKRLDAFLAICNTFAIGEPYFTVFDPATVEEAAWGLTEVSLNREFLPFSSAIKGYIRKITEQDYTEATLPGIFKIILETDEDEAPDIRKAVTAAVETENATVLQEYLNERIDDIAFQFSKVPSLEGTAKKLIVNPDIDLVDTL